jgi:hypothetical protein
MLTTAELDGYSTAHSGRMRMATPNLGALVVTLLLVLYGLYFVAAGRLATPELMAETSLIPTDSLDYAQGAEELSATGTPPIELLTGGLNWLSIPLAFRYFQDLGGFGPMAFVLINGACLYVWLSGAAALFGLYEPFRSLSCVLSVAAAPFLFGWMLAPNKELPTAAALILILRQIQNDRTGRVFVLSIFTALFKYQILIAALLYVFGRRLRHRRTLTLVGVSLVLPFLLPLIDALSITNFLENQENQVNSGAIFAALDQINAWPFGFVLVAPLRIAANIFAGLIPLRVFAYSEAADLLASLTSFTLGSLAILCLLKALTGRTLQRQLRNTSNCGYFLFCVALAFSLVPFLQVRYYWWAIPLMVGYLLRETLIPKGMGVQTADHTAAIT